MAASIRAEPGNGAQKDLLQAASNLSILSWNRFVTFVPEYVVKQFRVVLRSDSL
jgi:hypothetical protein